MKKGVLCAILLLLFFLIVGNKSHIFLATIKLNKTPTIIFLDPGHGGNDPGKVSPSGLKEKDINLQISLYTKSLLEKQHFKVILSRKEDVGLYDESDSNKKRSDLQNRVSAINHSNATLALCIHQNSYPSPSVHGAQVFYYNGSVQSQQLAKSIQQSLLQIDPSNHRQEKANQSYAILKCNCPIVIAECGFLSNPEESTLLADAIYQKKIAKALVQGVIDYLNPTE